MDGGSKDETVEVLKQFHHLRWRSEKDNGQSEAVCKGLGMATGDIIGWINSDDYYLPGTFAAVREIFEAHPEIDVVSGDYQFIASGGGVLRTRKEIPFNYDVHLYAAKCYLANAAMFFRKSVFDQFGGPRHELHYSMDFEFYLRIGRRAKFHHLRRVLAAYRIHEQSKTGKGIGPFLEETHRVQLEYLRKRPGCEKQNALTLGDQVMRQWVSARRILQKACAGCYL